MFQVLSIEDLPNEILIHIFSYFSFENGNWSKIMLVSRRWLLCGRSAFDFSINDNFGLRWACLDGRISSLISILAHPKVDPSFNNNEAIIFASLNNQLKVIDQLLLHPKVNPSNKDNQGMNTSFF